MAAATTRPVATSRLVSVPGHAIAQAAGLVGGVGYNAAADRRSWGHMKDFFGEIFAVKK